MAVVLTLGVLLGLGWLITLAKKAKTGSRVAAVDRVPQRLSIITTLSPPELASLVKQCARSTGFRDGGTFNDTTYLDNGRGLRVECVARPNGERTEMVVARASVQQSNGRPVRIGPMSDLMSAVHQRVVSSDPRASVR